MFFCPYILGCYFPDLVSPNRPFPSLFLAIDVRRPLSVFSEFALWVPALFSKYYSSDKFAFYHSIRPSCDHPLTLCPFKNDRTYIPVRFAVCVSLSCHFFRLSLISPPSLGTPSFRKPRVPPFPHKAFFSPFLPPRSPPPSPEPPFSVKATPAVRPERKRGDSHPQSEEEGEKEISPQK